MAVTIRVDSREVQAMLRVAPSLLAVNVRDEWRKHGKVFRDAVGRSFAVHSRNPRGARGWVYDKLKQYRRGPGDTGVRRGDAELGVFTTWPELLAHELGLTVTDPSGGAMAIAMGDASRKKLQRARGAFQVEGSGFSPGLFRAIGKTKRGRGQNEFKIIRLRGKLFAAEIDEQGEIVTLYARIVKSVKLKATLGFYATWERLRGERDASIDRALRKTIQDLNSARTFRTAGSEG